MANGPYATDDALRTLEGTPPSVPPERFRDADHTISFVRRLWENDEKRAMKRSKVDGLIAGNPPYRQQALRAANRSSDTNCNFGTGRSYMENAAGAFYDLTNEAPGCVAIRQSFGLTDELRDQYSQVMSGEADRILSEDDVWDAEVQWSQDQMVLHGRGPMIFEDPYSVLPISVRDGDLKVPERTRADTHYWEVCTVDRDYYPPQLYKFIENAQAATAVGWDVEFTRKVLQNAMRVMEQTGQLYTWEWYQDQLSSNSLDYYDDSKCCKLAHVFALEFDGTVTHMLVERDDTGITERKYLFKRRGRFTNFKQCVHPFYMDRGNGGFHHSVRGLGFKMFDAMDRENQLLCKLYDDAFAPDTLFRPTSSEARQKMELARYGHYAVLPAGWEAVQNPIRGNITDKIVMYRTSSDLMKANLSSYRTPVGPERPGNPETKFGRQLDATMQSSLTKTTFNRYYKQWDLMYTEIVRRLCNLNSTDERAKAFQERCMKKGVPRECFGCVETVEAVRVVGEGSAFLRKNSLMEMGAYVGSLPEDGKARWLNDFIAATCGQKNVGRYNPPQKQKQTADDQQFMALVAVGMMKEGIPPVVTPSQNPVTFAGTFLTVAAQALGSLKQGADPHTVLAFLDIAGPAILAHLKRFARDPLRKQVFDAIFKQWKQLSRVTDTLRKQVGAMAKQRQQQQAATQQAMSDQAIKAAKVKADIGLKTVKLRHQLAERSARTKQDLAIRDAVTASQINQQSRLSAFQE